MSKLPACDAALHVRPVVVHCPFARLADKARITTTLPAIWYKHCGSNGSLGSQAAERTTMAENVLQQRMIDGINLYAMRWRAMRNLKLMKNGRLKVVACAQDAAGPFLRQKAVTRWCVAVISMEVPNSQVVGTPSIGIPQ